VEHYEGILGTDQQACHLFVNLRLTKTDFPIRLHENMPIAQVQPVPRAALVREVMADIEVRTIATDAEWGLYEAAIAKPGSQPDRPFGAYAIAERRWQRGGWSTAR
jgi:hypothetical protein